MENLSKNNMYSTNIQIRINNENNYNELVKDLVGLKTICYNQFNQLTRSLSNILVFTDVVYKTRKEFNTDNVDLYTLPTLEWRSNSTGDVFDIHVISVNSDGLIQAVRNTDTDYDLENFIYCNIYELASLEDVISLLNNVSLKLNL